MIKNFNDFLLETKTEIPLLIDGSRFLKGILGAAKKANVIKYVSEYLDSSDYRILPVWATMADRPSKKVIFDNRFSVNEHIFLMNKQLFVASNLVDEKYVNREKREVPEKISKNYYSIYDMDTINPGYIIVESMNSFDIKIIEKIFTDEVSGAVGKKVYNFNRSLVEDNSQTAKELNFYSGGRYSEYAKKTSSYQKPYFVVFKYEMSESKAEEITLDDIQATQEYKDLISSMPVELASTPRQLSKKDITLSFGIPADHIIEFNMEDGQGRFTRDNSKWIHYGYALYTRGYIRSIPLWQSTRGWGGDQAHPVGNFNPGTLEGWKEGLVKIKEKFKKMIIEFENDSSVIFSREKIVSPDDISDETQEKIISRAIAGEVPWEKIKKWVKPEKLHAHRGKILTKQLGI